VRLGHGGIISPDTDAIRRLRVDPDEGGGVPEHALQNPPRAAARRVAKVPYWDAREEARSWSLYRPG